MKHEILTPEQVADYLQMRTETIYRLIRQKKLAATRIGRHYRVPKADLEQFLQQSSTRDEVRQAAFARVLQIAERHPSLNSDAILEELEQDEEKGSPSAIAR